VWFTGGGNLSDLALAPILLLVAAVVLRSLPGNHKNLRVRRLRDAANVALIPLGIIFIATIILRASSTIATPR
jgi:hypothetical protein